LSEADVCKRYKKVAFSTTGPKEAIFTRLRCKQWTCDYCADKNARTWQYWLIKRLPEVSGEWWLLTITAHRNTRSQALSLANIRTKIDTLIKRVKRVWGNDIEYVRVFEKHPSSEAIHAHLVISGLTPYVVNGYSVKHRPMSIGVLTRTAWNGTWSVKTWFKKTCQDLKMGMQADVQLINDNPSRAAFYVTKYLTKDQQAFHVAHLRHVQVTQGIGKPKFDSEYQWTPASYITTYTFEAGTKVTDIDTGFIIDNNYWETKGFYPDDNLTT